MSLLFGRRAAEPSPVVERATSLDGFAGFTGRDSSAAPRVVTPDAAFRHSSVWAAVRLRANLLSSCRVTLVREVGGADVPVTPSPLVRDPGGDGRGTGPWLWASQVDLDQLGNAVGIITSRDGSGRPASVEWVPAVTARADVMGSRVVKWHIGSASYAPSEIWHEVQYPETGSPFGRSVVAYAAELIFAHTASVRSAGEFYDAGGVPQSVLSNNLVDLTPAQIDRVRATWRAATARREVGVLGKGWTYDLADVPKQTDQFLAMMQASTPEIARWFDVPADMIDGASTGSSITYANIAQRNMQFLMTSLGPLLKRRAAALSAATAAPRRVIIDATEAILGMDPQTAASVYGGLVGGGIMTRDEARLQLSRLGLTPATPMPDLPVTSDGTAAIGA